MKELKKRKMWKKMKKLKKRIIIFTFVKKNENVEKKERCEKNEKVEKKSWKNEKVEKMKTLRRKYWSSILCIDKNKHDSCGRKYIAKS